MSREKPNSSRDMKKAQEALTGIYADAPLEKRSHLLGYDSVEDYVEAARLGNEYNDAQSRGDLEAAREYRRLRRAIQKRNPRTWARKAALLKKWRSKNRNRASAD